MYPLIDIGCNLASPRLMRELERILADAKKAKVITQIITGSDNDSNQTALALIEQYPELFCTIGFHPHHANDWQPRHHPPAHLIASRSEKVVAIGEMGLDYFRNLATHANQQRCFADQLDIAIQTQKPVFLHERDAFADFRAILSEKLPYLSGAVWHCFTANADALDWALSEGLSIGITGWIADPERGKNLRELVKRIPDERLMIETDAPYLTPKTLRPTPRINEPQYLPEVLRVLAECREQSMETLATITTANAQRFFQLPQLALTPSK